MSDRTGEWTNEWRVKAEGGISEQEDSRPNIILIMTDQQRYDTIAGLGFPYADTPNLDRLIREGTVLTDCHITAPSCVPSRASLFTGYYPHTTGVYKNGDRWTRSWVEQLAESGYHCVNVGKMHTVPFETPLGFHERYVVENKDRFLEARYYFDEWDKGLAAKGLVKQQRELYRKRDDYRGSLGAFTWDLPEETHSDFFVADMAKWWLETYPVTKPLFLEIGFPGPHPPYDPVPRYLEKYDGKKDLGVREVSEEDLAGQPSPFKRLREHNFKVDHDSVVHLENPTAEQRRRQRAYYLANVTMIDEKIGELLETLDDRGYLENSMVIFTSDHGDCLGDHGHSQKWTMYDIITRVPTIVWSPGRVPAGEKLTGLYQMMDIGPTVLELAGVPVPESFDARSMLPDLMGTGDRRGREYVFAEHGRDNILEGAATMTMVRSREWKLVVFSGTDEDVHATTDGETVGGSEGQLFNLVEDPEEIYNLWDDPEAAAVKTELLETHRRWLVDSMYRTRTWSRSCR
jgi:arylsulfatase